MCFSASNLVEFQITCFCLFPTVAVIFSILTWVHPRLQPANTGQAAVISICNTALSGVKDPGLKSGFRWWKLTFWPRKRLLVESTVKLSTGDPSVVLSADAALLTSPCFCWHNRMHNINHLSHNYNPPAPLKNTITTAGVLTGSSTFAFPPDFFALIFLAAVFLTGLGFFSGAGERGVSSLPLAPLFLARSSGWMLGRTPPAAIVTPFSNWKKRPHKVTPVVPAAFTGKRGMKGEKDFRQPSVV